MALPPIALPEDWKGSPGVSDGSECFRCQKPTKMRFYVWYDLENGLLVDPKDHEEGEYAQMPVGPDCAKLIPKGYVEG